jgi:hypothetical protein
MHMEKINWSLNKTSRLGGSKVQGMSRVNRCMIKINFCDTFGITKCTHQFLSTFSTLDVNIVLTCFGF